MLHHRLPKRVNGRIDVIDDELADKAAAKQGYSGASAASVWLHVDPPTQT